MTRPSVSSAKRGSGCSKYRWYATHVVKFYVRKDEVRVGSNSP